MKTAALLLTGFAAGIVAAGIVIVLATMCDEESYD